jgi:hypothetical protein
MKTIITMEENKKKNIEKFLKTHFSNLELSESAPKKFKSLHKKNSKEGIFLYEEKNSQIFVDQKTVIYPILKIFDSEYDETYELIKEWLKKTYELDSDEIVGI